jgi:hypothetical protein
MLHTKYCSRHGFNPQRNVLTAMQKRALTAIFFLTAIFGSPHAASAKDLLPDPLPDQELAADAGGTAVLITVRADATNAQPGMIEAEASGNFRGIETFNLDQSDLSRSQAATSLSVRFNLPAGPGNSAF